MAYTYLIGWKNLDKWYYGVRFSKNCKPQELWNTYFTSSKKVALFRKKHGEPDVIEIRRQFTSISKARYWEHKVLHRLRVVESEKWLNQTDNKSVDPTQALIGAKSSKSIKTKQKMSKSHLGKKHSEETKQKMRQAKLGKPGYWKGKQRSSETKNKMSAYGKSLVGKKNPFFGRTHTEETKEIIRQAKQKTNIS